MKILITNHHLENRAGSEMFTVGLSCKLKKRGHDVIVFSPFFGPIAEKIKERDILVVDDLNSIKGDKIDIIHAQHNVTAIMARSIFPEVPMVFMSHGVLPELEQPPSVDLGVSKFVAVSEEVAENLKNKGVSEDKISIVRNFVDAEKFYPKEPINKKPKKLLVLSNHYTDEVRLVIETACKDLGIEVYHVGMPENSVDNVEDYINKVDIVVTLGRGVLEAMACGRNVIVYDINGGDGLVDENNFFDLRKNNFSGRYCKLKYTAEAFKKEILKYDSGLGKKLRKIVVTENPLDAIVDKLESIYEDVNFEKIPISQIRNYQLYNEINFLEKQSLKIREVFEGIVYSKDQEILSKKEEILRKDFEIHQKDLLILQKDKEINIRKQESLVMKNSKFWKMREMYMKAKKVLFLKNYFKKP